MRHLARRMGAPYTICEVMLDHFVTSLRDRARTRRFLMLTDDDHPAAAQLMGADPAAFPAAARRLVDAGFDVIDINFGCPVKKVLGRCRGGYHLGQPDVAMEIMHRVRDAVPPSVPVTVKMRRGIDLSAESRDRFDRILEGAFDAGIDAVTVHARTVQQRYAGRADWEFLKQLRNNWPQHTILGSGDLHTAGDCVRMIRQTGVSGVTAARGSIGNPWIYRQCRALLAGRPLPPPPSVHEQRDVMRLHFACILQVYPQKLACGRMRRFSLRYADWHPQREQVRKDFIAVRSQDDWMHVMKRWYDTDQPGRYPSEPAERHSGAGTDAGEQACRSSDADSGP